MSNKQMLKKIERALKFLVDGKARDAVDVLFELRTKLKEEIEKEENKSVDNRELRHLVGWYLQIWDNRPPEMFRYTVEYKAIIAKHLKELMQIYKRNNESIEQLKKDYEMFKKTKKEWNGLLNFRSQLPNIKSKSNSDKDWVSPENQRGKSFYLKNWATEDEEDIPF